MPALKSDNPTNALINKNFVIRVSEYEGKKRVFVDNGKTDVENVVDIYSKSKLTTARKCIEYILDEELKMRLFKKVLEGRQYKYSFKIRKRLRVDFHSK